MVALIDDNDHNEFIKCSVKRGITRIKFLYFDNILIVVFKPELAIKNQFHCPTNIDKECWVRYRRLMIDSHTCTDDLKLIFSFSMIDKYVGEVCAYL